MEDRDVEFRLKNLYDRIHRGFSLTLNDLVFLSRYDVDCYVRTYQHLVLGDQPGQKEVPVIRGSVPYTRYLSSLQDHIDLLIGELRTREMKTDIMMGLDGAEVMKLIDEPHVPESEPVTKYQYFGAYENPSLLNLKV